LTSGALFGENISSDMILVQSNYGALPNGNFEVLCGDGNGHLRHYYRNNVSAPYQWQPIKSPAGRKMILGNDIASKPSLIQSNIGKKVDCTPDN
jgi:hypothetical protein